MQIFHTRREEEEIILIQSYFPDMTIINPSEIDPKDLSGQEIMELCYELVAKADITIFSEYPRKIILGSVIVAVKSWTTALAILEM